MQVVRGSILPPGEAPLEGERTEELTHVGNVRIEHILSGTLLAPTDYDQSHDEWVLLLAGAAVLDVGDERLNLAEGDWVLLPAHQRHRLIETQPGTSWLAIHALDAQ